MLNHQMIHPDINRILGRAGHHSKILIADGHYPAWSKKGPNSEVIHLNFAPGIVNCSQVLRGILSAVPIDEINTMGIPPEDPYAKYGEPPVWAEYKAILSEFHSPLELKPIQKWEFYDAVQSNDHVLTIQTAELALWANLLLSIGVRTA
ncbi:MAG: RbsD/FucU family protein [Verrucomicrobia bacterium]|nr:RbsD/FucU family protein [Verrucomicrobiota bacterium]